jgi:hypothetical protein
VTGKTGGLRSGSFWFVSLESRSSPWHCPPMELDPDLTFCGLSLWVHQRQFPNATDYWDGNWLAISATMEASGAFVRCGGPILMTADIERFRNGVAAMAATLRGEAELFGLEPGLNVKLTTRDGKRSFGWRDRDNPGSH